METPNFQVIPAVDLLGDEAVRLERGDYDRVSLRDRDPAALVARFVAAGADLVHVVDLDGARSRVLRPELIGRLVQAARAGRARASGGRSGSGAWCRRQGRRAFRLPAASARLPTRTPCSRPGLYGSSSG